MATFDGPAINVEEYSTEENLNATKSYLYGLADKLNYEVNVLQEQIAALSTRISNLEGSKE